MTPPTDLRSILFSLGEATREMIGLADGIPENVFLQPAGEKWSPAFHLLHLAEAAKATRLAYTLPGFILRLYTGKPNRPSRHYDELVARYRQRLQEGGKASGRFVPSDKQGAFNKFAVIARFTEETHRLEKAMSRIRNEHTLDRYLAPHPLLGKITLRELAYFSVYHILHHAALIRGQAATA